MRKSPSLAVAGVTGAVGQEFLRILAERRFPFSRLTLLASARSAGREIEFLGKTYVVQELTEDSFDGVDLALFSAGGAISRKFAPIAAQRGCVVVDNSSAFRMDPNVPLVVPEVNPQDIARHRGIIANPNCSTILMLVALEPLRKRFGVSRIVVSTYQAVSGAGAAAIEELSRQAAEVLAGREVTRNVFKEQCAFNVFSHNSAVDESTGLNGEEQKMISETRRIWSDPGVEVSPMCVRVPVERAHSESICVTLKEPASEAQVRDALAGAPGIELIDERSSNRFPTPLHASGKDAVFVGRLRADPGSPRDAQGRSRNHCLFLAGDQLRKGAALNGGQIGDRFFVK